MVALGVTTAADPYDEVERLGNTEKVRINIFVEIATDIFRGWRIVIAVVG